MNSVVPVAIYSGERTPNVRSKLPLRPGFEILGLQPDGDGRMRLAELSDDMGLNAVGPAIASGNRQHQLASVFRVMNRVFGVRDRAHGPVGVFVEDSPGGGAVAQVCAETVFEQRYCA